MFFNRKLFFFQICFLDEKGNQHALIVTNKKYQVTKKMIMESASKLGISPNIMPLNVFCLGYMTQKEWDFK